MDRKVDQFMVFVLWFFVAAGLYMLIGLFFIPSLPSSNSYWFLPFFLAAIIMTLKEVYPRNEQGKRIVGSPIFLVGRFGLFVLICWFSIFGPVLVTEYPQVHLIVSYEIAVFFVVSVLFFASGGYFITTAGTILTIKWILLSSWAIWLGLSINRVIMGGSNVEFFVDSLVDSYIIGCLSIPGGLILMAALLFLRRFIGLFVWLYRKGFARSSNS
jgi:hypothetical protein